MSGHVNKVILIGNLGADPEIRRTQDGRPIANLRIATSESWRDKSTGERGVIHAGPPLGAKAREEVVQQPARKRLRSMATIGQGADTQQEAEAEQDQPRKRRGGLRSE